MMPDLQQARYDHSSCCMGNTVYVFGGYAGANDLDTIECLLVKAAKDAKITFDNAQWRILLDRPLTDRRLSLFCPLYKDQVLICGGFGDGNRLFDGVIWKHETKITDQVIEDSGLEFTCYNPGYAMDDDTCVSIVLAGENSIPVLVQFDKRTLKVSILKNFRSEEP